MKFLQGSLVMQTHVPFTDAVKGVTDDKLQQSITRCDSHDMSGTGARLLLDCVSADATVVKPPCIVDVKLPR